MGERFLREALPLISSYFSGEKVPLGPTEVESGDHANEEFRRFQREIRLRHALACSVQLTQIVQGIERGTSTENILEREESRGAILGRLDIPRYMARRASVKSWPRLYPILKTSETPRTPENILAKRMMRDLAERLESSNFPRSAETLETQRYRAWYANRFKREPWIAVPFTSSSVESLQQQSERRVAKRQTGNEVAYNALLGFLRASGLYGPPLGSMGEMARALLSFPTDESFLDRIFEIWCLLQIASAMTKLGAIPTAESGPLWQFKGRPIYQFKLGDDHLAIWFQKALSADAATWSYGSGAKLRGIPDTVVVANEQHYFLFDAKNRIVLSNTRPEETYKVLGYLENFRPILNNSTTHAALAFVSPTHFEQELIDPIHRRIKLIAAHPDDVDACAFQDQLAESLSSWLDAVKKG